MKKYVYPAVFNKEADGGYSVSFPNFEYAHTCGDNLVEAMNMAEDCLGLVLYDLKQDKKMLPQPTDIKQIKVNDDQFVNLIALDYNDYVRRTETKPVRKTLYIPRNLNDEGEALGINFSQVLRTALEKQLSKA